MRALARHPFASLLALLALALLLVPVVVIVGVSLNAGDVQFFPPHGLSLRWYAAAIGRPEFRAAALRSLGLAAICSAIGVGIGTLAACGLTRPGFRQAPLLETVLLLPLLVPQVVVGMAFLVVMVRLGVPPMTMLLVVHVILVLPFAVRVTVAALLKADRRIVLAARSLGASPLTAFRRVTLPLIRPGLLTAAVFAFVTSFENFTASQFLIWKDTTLPIELFHSMRTESDPTVTALSALLMLAVAAVIIAATAIWRLDAVRLTGRRG